MKCYYLMSLLLLSTTITNCHSYNKGIIGIYESKKYGFISKSYLHFFKNTTFVLRSNLELKNDSTYTLKTCGNIIEGDWVVKKDTLFLFCKSNRYIQQIPKEMADSLKPLSCGNGEPTIFLIEKNKLKREWEHNHRKVLNYFVKVN